eukprot:Blabericola_migrator_1__6416@NODE_3235_length_1927_cov_16_397312_g2026_i0_p1_GENE_NODE_3235_length_1927_cov_16_397312_g2026_i0NODE_3235_length_1927_cov_16_397312_g2026_i0_p1_ORF_typecomplete_len160_score15_21CD34_antigen/PF06365_12/0_061_NODE_3235_length_1927_cov_16_397312_g2026_i011131592
MHLRLPNCLHISKKRRNPSYILGPLPPGVASDDPSTINIDGVVYGVYKETPSGLEPVVNKTWRLKTTTSPPTLGFSFPTYPSVELSSSTAVGPVASLEAIVNQHFWETVIGVGGIATAAVVAFYMCYHNRRPHTSTQTLIDQYTRHQNAAHPLTAAPCY